MIRKKYYEQQYAQKFDNLDEIDKNPRKTQTTETGSRRNRHSEQAYSK